MKLRPPSVPLITVDPYFSVWSPSEKLYDTQTEHWTGSPNNIIGNVIIDGESFCFLGKSEEKVIEQVYFDMSALVTDYVFANEKIVLKASFYTPLFVDDLYRMSRPVSYLKLDYESADGIKHDVSVKISVSEELCIDKAGDIEVVAEKITLSDGRECAKIGSKDQKILEKFGDDLRIDWGYFYLCGPQKATASIFSDNNMTFVSTEFNAKESEEYYVAFAYDDIYSLNYFGKSVEAYWKSKKISIEEAIIEALNESEEMLIKCREISEDLFEEAESKGGEKYAELLSLAYRQLIAAHKVALDENDEIIFISKECFSNGCAATVDVTYPSAPFFMLYNIELLKGMLRPIFKYAYSDEWVFDFAPHDVGTYPKVTGQRYGWKSKTLEEYRTKQMPVEECGNMLVMMANISLIEGNTKFADEHMGILEQWVKYLEEYGNDPENQLCTDDFAGHLAHNCNLSLKAIMGIMGYSIILKLQNKEAESNKYADIAKKMANSWCDRAANEDGSFRLAFDKPDTYSMKYNIVWDKLWGTKLFAPSVINSEFSSNKKHINAYGMPLDNRKSYTKSDWLVWTATLAYSKEEFEEFIEPMWNAYNVTPSRVPMSDWYDTITSEWISFKHRSVQGGLFIKLLEGIF